VAVFDESHTLRTGRKQGETMQTKAALRVGLHSRRVVLLSGTPTITKPFDLFNQAALLRPGLLGQDKKAFAKVCCMLPRPAFMWWRAVLFCGR
jgi:hypothetical protein